MIFGFYRAFTRLHLVHCTIFPRTYNLYIGAENRRHHQSDPTDATMKPKLVADPWSACPASRANSIKGMSEHKAQAMLVPFHNLR
jgi:hypothetical protein